MPKTSRMGAAEDALLALLQARAAVTGSPLKEVPIDLGHPGDKLAHEHVWITEDAEGTQEWETTMGSTGQKTESVELSVVVWADISDTYQKARDRALDMAGEVELAVRDDFTLGSGVLDEAVFQGEVVRIRKMAGVGEAGRPVQVMVDVRVMSLLS